MDVVLETTCLRWVISPDGRTRHFVDKATGADYGRGAACATLRRAGRDFDATSAALADGRLAFRFGEADARAVIGVTFAERSLVFEVLDVQAGNGDEVVEHVTDVRSEAVEELVFVNVPLALKGTPDESFVACALALNLRTNVVALPRAQDHLRATCCRRIGFAGAKAAVIACPQPALRSVMQEAVSAAPDLPHSPLGGPWALEPAVNRGSYLFNFGGLSEDTVDDWIRLAKTLGLNQIDFHGGESFRFGDCVPNAKTYPRGRASLKAVVDRLHAAGLAAGFHTYAFFMAKSARWVTPVPDPRLGSNATFILAAPLDPCEDRVPVLEPTGGMSTITGFFVRNSVTLRIENELITYAGVAKEPPYGFTGCTRGALGTAAAACSSPRSWAGGPRRRGPARSSSRRSPRTSNTCAASASARTAASR